MFNWVIEKDETRNFLYGRGGSRKSTPVYKLSKIVSNNGQYIEIYDSKTFYLVVLLS